MMRVIIVLSLFVAVAVLAVVGTEVRERRRARREAAGEPVSEPDAECCGQHLVCERESLLSATDEVEYYDDEELDALANRDADKYSEEEVKALEEVFYSLREHEVAGWCRSLQMRGIALPDRLRDEALLIVRERRSIRS